MIGENLFEKPLPFQASIVHVKVNHFKERLEAAQQKLQLGHEELQVGAESVSWCSTWVRIIQNPQVPEANQIDGSQKSF